MCGVEIGKMFSSIYSKYNSVLNNYVVNDDGINCYCLKYRCVIYYIKGNKWNKCN